MKPRTSLILTMILAAAATRLLPHYPNATPIAAMALFGGACFANRWLAACIPLVAMLASDLILGFHSTQMVVYGCFLIISGMGMMLQARRRQPLWIGGATLTSSLLFS